MNAKYYEEFLKIIKTQFIFKAMVYESEIANKTF